MRGSRSPILLLALAVVLLAGCGNGPPAPNGGGPVLGPPLIERTEAEHGTEAVLLQARAPCRLVLVGDGFGSEGGIRDLTHHDLPAGRTIRLEWNLLEIEAPPEARGEPPAEAVAEGRTEAHEVVLTCVFGDFGGILDRTIVWTRPGRARAVRQTPPPPSNAEALPFGTVRELDVLVVADAAKAKVRITTPDDRTRARLVDPEPGDRLEAFRLMLRVENAPGGRSQVR